MMKIPRTIIVIPARFGSTRFPGKPLVMFRNRTMIEHVYRVAEKVPDISAVVVGTDDERIFRVVEDFGGNVMLTSKKHQSGTDRVAEVASKMDFDIVVNLQGDEPFLDPRAVKEVVAPLVKEPDVQMSTLMKKSDVLNDLKNPNVVKVVVDNFSNALYFSRASIPYFKEGNKFYFFKHIGLYAYRKPFLLKLTKLHPTMLEQTESLEQLRVLEHGYCIKVIETVYDSVGIDTPEQLDQALKSLRIDDAYR